MEIIESMSNIKLKKFGADWCHPCKMMAPIIKDLANVVEVEEFDVDDTAEDVLIKYKVRNVPLIVLEDKQGNELWRNIGFISKETILDKIQEYE